MVVSIEPHISVAFAMHASPGTYALLLGAGISIPAGVPAAWQVLDQLVGDVAELLDEPRPAAPRTWWHEKYGENATYDGVLGALTHSQEERRALLAPLFEPADVDADAGYKQPTAAHNAIAQLVANHAVRIILTTNFDLLLEQAIRAHGVEPVVASTPAAILGLNPLHAQRCVVVHLHGDYLSPGTLNTQDELGTYDRAVDALLDKVFDEYGLVIAGWSAASDTALRSAVERSPSRRFATYWINPAQPQEDARRVIAHRSAVVVAATADDFFSRLGDAFTSLSELERASHPLAIRSEVATAKRELSGRSVAIDLHDRLRAEIEHVAHSETVTTDDFSTSHSRAELSRRVSVLENDAERLIALVATSAYWGNTETDSYWFDAIERLAHRRHVGGSTALIDLTRAGAVLVAYAAGVAAIARRRFDLVARVLKEPMTDTPNASDRAAVLRVLGPRTLGVDNPSQHLHELLRTPIADLLSLGNAQYVSAWEMFEYVNLLTRGDLWWFPYLRVEGIGPWEARTTPSVSLREELVREGEDHPLIAYGLFDLDGLIERMDVLDGGIGQWSKSVDYRLIPIAGGMLPSGRHYPGTYSDDA